MTNADKYDAAFCEALELTEEQLKGLEYQGVDTWDSVGHMNMMAALEDAFDIMMEKESEKLDEGLAEEERLQREAEALLASLGIKL